MGSSPPSRRRSDGHRASRGVPFVRVRSRSRSGRVEPHLEVASTPDGTGRPTGLMRCEHWVRTLFDQEFCAEPGTRRASQRWVLSLPSGCHPPVASRPPVRPPRPATRTSNSRTSAPAICFSRARRSSARNRTWVAQAGSSTSTNSTPRSSRIGRTWSATAGPTASSQRPNTPPTSARPAPGRSERTTRSSEAVNGTGSGPPRRSSLIVAPPPGQYRTCV